MRLRRLVSAAPAFDRGRWSATSAKGSVVLRTRSVGPVPSSSVFSETMSPVRLYYMPRTRSSRALWMLEEIEEPYELVEIAGADRRSDAHLARHPLGRVPALALEDGTLLFESAAIRVPLPALIP